MKRICSENGYDRKKKGGPKGPPRMVQSIRSAYNRSTSKAPSWKNKKGCLNVNLSDLIILSGFEMEMVTKICTFLLEFSVNA